MIHRRLEQVSAEVLDIPGTTGSELAWLTDKTAPARFYMRRVIIAPGGVVKSHDHPWEHEMYYLSGQGEVQGPAGMVSVSPGDYVEIKAGERHETRNTGPEDLVFICCVGAPPEGETF
ncbi:MAG: cupin domain-containing protein [Proteobacteria bacterium]|nr:cupin domain-containing protein [Pseudomonadota bacterium]